jgi:transcriptional regulator with PAS, ATPase and Fis domain
MNNQEQHIINTRVLRRKAEKELKTKDETSNIPLSEIEVKKLMHELQVHQIELEMQNEELQQAYETTEAALKKYTMLYDFAPMGYFTLDADGIICELNFTGADMLGDRRFSLINNNFKMFISEEFRSEFNDFLQQLYTGNAKESCKMTLENDIMPRRVVYMEGFVSGEDQKCFLAMIDMSDFKNL